MIILVLLESSFQNRKADEKLPHQSCSTFLCNLALRESKLAGPFQQLQLKISLSSRKHLAENRYKWTGSCFLTVEMLTQRELAETQVTEKEFSLSHRCVCVDRECWSTPARLFGHLSFHRCFTASCPVVFTRLPAGSVKALPEA